MIRRHRLNLFALVLCLGLLGAGGSAVASAGSVSFEGKEVRVPAGYSVVRLAEQPRLCVRLDRRVVYLGAPSPQQNCPADAIGRRRAILVEPESAGASRSLIPAARIGASASAGGSVFTGLGFDACTAPTSRQMAAWESSPYRAVGVYIGGINRGCSQPALTESWVAAQTGAGWHLIPTYVGLQAPTSSCSDCGKLNANQATAQGAAAAEDAVSEAGAIAMGPGSPIYFDMESYSRTSSAAAATLAFLESWTEKLHALGYVSGVYSSSASGIVDLAGQIGTGYTLPDEIWTANWNGQENTLDPNLPASSWANHHRIHQYRGGHDETWGGTTINIDNNYVDGTTVGGAALPAEDDPIGALELTGSPLPGQVRVKGWAFDPNAPAKTLAIRLYIGGRAGSPNALEYELGPIAVGERPDIAALYPQAGALHGFDVTLPTVKSGAQPICAYAIDIGAGADRLLGCETRRIPVAITLSKIQSTRRGVQLRITCTWPTELACPGQLALRTRFKVAVRRGHGRPPLLKTVKRSLGRRTFNLSGGRTHAFVIPLSLGARALLAERGTLRTQVVAAIPGGRRVSVLPIEHRPR